MPAIRTELEIEMEDGETYRVVADQRDFARWEGQDFYDPDRKNMMTRFIGWSAAKRQGKTRLPWEPFNIECVQVGSAPDAEDDDVDPTQMDQSTAN
jgi:hypothetical protein